MITLDVRLYEDGDYIVTCRQWKYFSAFGETPEAAMRSAADAFCGFIECMREHGVMPEFELFKEEK